MDSPLFIDSAERQKTDDWLSRRLTQALANVREGKVSPTFNLDEFNRKLKSKNFEQPEPLQPLLEWTVHNMETGAVQMTHPRYFGLFNPAPSYPSECADRIAAALNPQICVLSHAPAAVLIETHVIKQIAKRVGYGDFAGGHFTSGGSEANATAVACALTRALPQFASEGARAFGGQPRVYVSNESHLAWLKIAHTSGIGRCAIRMVATDGMGRMCARALTACIEADIACGDVPVMIAATAGTTNAGMVDPVKECSRLALKHAMWLHVDAAWGGALIADRDQSRVLSGIELADSVTIDAHKWFATTMGTGMFVTPHVDMLEASFHAKASYMPSSDAQVDYYLTSLQWSRRFSGLRLFLALAAGGWGAFARHIRRGQSLIERLNTMLCEAGWTVMNESDMAVTCVVPPDHPVDNSGSRVTTIVNDVVARGNVWVSMALFENQPVIRVCVTNGHTKEFDIDQLAEELIHASAH